MPYITKAKRDEFDAAMAAGFTPDIRSPGELNYLITDLCDAYMRRGHKSYQEINDIIGALEGAKLEFYRRVAAPYEDIKRQENGDVYTP